MSAGCPTCGEAVGSEDRFCEGCGAPLDAPATSTVTTAAVPDTASGDEFPDVGERTDLRATLGTTCPACDQPVTSADGLCDECGRPARDGREHVTAALTGGPRAPVALTDRGRVRARNEDAYAVGRTTGPDGPTVVAVVCDGVASVPRGAEASLAACEAALAAGLDRAGGGAAPEAVSTAACEAAVSAVAGLVDPDDTDADPPSCTYVAAVHRGGEVVVASIGDSRAYWLGADGPSHQIGADDSWAAAMVDAGLISAERAWADPRAHVLTRWVAADAPTGPPRVTVLRPEQPGTLLLCSDGLWNDLPDADGLAARVGDGHDLPAAARALLTAALGAGGHDNTTLVLVPAGDAEDPADPEEDRA